MEKREQPTTTTNKQNEHYLWVENTDSSISGRGSANTSSPNEIVSLRIYIYDPNLITGWRLLYLRVNFVPSSHSIAVNFIWFLVQLFAAELIYYYFPFTWTSLLTFTRAFGYFHQQCGHSLRFLFCPWFIESEANGSDGMEREKTNWKCDAEIFQFHGVTICNWWQHLLMLANMASSCTPPKYTVDKLRLFIWNLFIKLWNITVFALALYLHSTCIFAKQTRKTEEEKHYSA